MPHPPSHTGRSPDVTGARRRITFRARATASHPCARSPDGWFDWCSSPTAREMGPQVTE
ncbi:hypothetical protein Ae406Ps2_2296c [Pseudonocardia sp. Ae406_Ps2]|nr:hypothetical protein Ae406Ps2_2296c [Pseudonocardia sp. Ae406_Ps2]